MGRLALLCAGLCLCALPAAAGAEGEVRGRLGGDFAGAGIVYAADLPEATAPPGAPHAVMKQLHLHFSPQVLPILQGTAVDFVNEDSTAHNVFSPSPPDAFDLGNFGGTRSHLFREPGPRVILCNVHLEMVAWILVLRSPAFAALDGERRFSLKLAPGKHQLVLWRPREPDLKKEIEVPMDGKLEFEWDLAGR